MKKLFLLLFVSLLCKESFSQKFIPNVKIQNIDFQYIESNKRTDKGLIVLTFWATWCAPCIDELNAIQEIYSEWKNEFNFDLLAISIDDNRTISRVRPMVNSFDWDFEILIDKNQEFKRALQIVNIPYLLIVKDGEILYQQTGYKPGGEDLLYSKIKELSKQTLTP